MRAFESVSVLFVAILLTLSCGAGGAGRSGSADPSSRTGGSESTSNDRAPAPDETGGRRPDPPRAPDSDDDSDDDGRGEAPIAPQPPRSSLSAFEAGILAEHNRVRASVQPAASPALPPLVWDEALARLAGDWTSRCPEGHRPDNDYGENIYWSGGMPATPQAAVGSWAAEAQYYDYRSTVCARDGRRSWFHCGHYTQVVWRETTRVGCAVRSDCPGQFENVVVCNYDPPGNVNVSSTSIPHPY